jgi:predicted O-methyltransferase YrrM
MSRLERLGAYPARYGEALRLRRRVRALPDDLPFDAALALAREIGITQKEDEIRALFDRVRSEQPMRILEIGLDRGGTLFLWTRAASPDAHLISVDTCPLGPLGRLAPFAVSRRGFARAKQRIELLMPSDSHSEETRRSIASSFGGEPIDFLFIDGDHTYDGVRRDFELYAPMVRPGGWSRSTTSRQRSRSDSPRGLRGTGRRSRPAMCTKSSWRTASRDSGSASSA